MKTAKWGYFTSLFFIVIAAGHGAAPLFIFSFLFAMTPKDKLFLLSCMHLLSIGILIGSFFLKNERVKRIFENASLIFGVGFYWLLLGSKIAKDIPIVTQLPFLIFFGLFLYFKLMRYFNSSANEQQ